MIFKYYYNVFCFFVCSSLRPVVVEPYEVIDDVDGFPEKSIIRKPADYMKAREVRKCLNTNFFV